jgi:serine/threonine-protein kinase
MDFEGNAKDTIISQTTAAAVAKAREEVSYLGYRIKDRYAIEKQLDSGGFGAVYLAHDEQLLGKPVVIKFLLEKSLRNDWAVKKFKHEIEALTRIDHPGVVGILDTGQLPDATPFLVMQYIKGVSLRTLMKQEGLEFERASTFIRQLGQALNAAHEIGVVHRDLKPENIMLRRVAGGEQVKIIDFGIAKVRDSQVAPSTVFAEVAGTVAYMAPEQLNGRPVSPATDQFSLGVIAFEMLTGRRPFNPETQFQLEGMQRDGVKLKPKELRPGLPQTAETVLLKALAYHPAQRYPTARAFADALADALVESGLVGQNADSAADTILRTVVTEVPAPTRSRRALWLVPAGLVLIAIIVGIAAMLSRQNARKSASNLKAPVAETTALRKLDYSLSVQKMRKGKPYEPPYETAGNAILENGYDVRLNISSPQAGYLYLVNEGPAGNGLVTYNMLFPTPGLNKGSAQLEANKKQSTDWFELDQNQGVEKLWLIWSETPVPELEAVKGVVNPTQKGTVTNPDHENAVRRFLDQHAATRPDVQTDAESNVNRLTAKGSVLVNLIRLEHH